MNNAYTFDDIQIVPLYSDVLSRNECSLRTRVTKNNWIQNPYVSSPMDTVTESEMSLSMASYGGLGVIHRFNTIDEQVSLCNASKLIKPKWGDGSIMKDGPIYYGTSYIAAAIGATGDYQERALELVKCIATSNEETYDYRPILLIDVAHGNTIQMKNAINWCKYNLPYYVEIIAGNVATREGARNLAEWGADAIRVGIGGGCFTPNMTIATEIGDRKIIDIQVGDKVYTHTGNLHTVTDKFEYDRDEEIMNINDIECTKNHEFYVVHRDDIMNINENNIHSFAKWVTAENLTNEYYLIELD